MNFSRIIVPLLALLLLAACKNPNPMTPPSPTPVPAAPAGATATAGNTQNVINWNATNYATSYNIYTASSAANAHKGNSNAIKITLGNVITYNHTGLTNGTTYYYVVTAQNLNGESAESSQVNATPMATLPPTAITVAASNIASVSATLTGTVNPNGFTTTVAFQWGTTTSYGSTTASQAAGAGTVDVPVTANLTGLTPGNAYHFRLVAQNANGTAYGLDQSFTTPTPPASPTGVTATPGNNQNIINWNTVSGATSYNIYWSNVTGVNKTNGTKITGATSPYPHTGLTNGTPYFYVVTAQDANGESVESAEASATPMPTPPPAAVTGAASSITTTTATLNGTVNPNGFATTWAFQWGATTGYGNATASTSAGAGTADVPVTANLTMLTQGTTYHFRLVAQNANGTTYGLDQSFVTLAPPAAPSGVTATASNAANTINWNSVSGATSYNIYWSNVTGVNKTNGTKITGATSPYPHTGLSNGTTYYYVVTAQNAIGESVESAEASATPNRISIDGRLYGGLPGSNALVSVLNNGANVSTATVSINGTSLVYNGPNQDYEATVAVTPGASYTITVTIPGDPNTYTTTGTMFSTYPSITTPSSGFSWSILVAHTINWNQGAPTAGPPTPFNEIALLKTSNNAYLYPSTGAPKQIPLATTFTIPGGSISISLATSANLYVGISQSITIPNAGNGGTFTMTGFSTGVPGTITLL